MEWTKYILSMILGGCLLILFGGKEQGRNKWLFGAGAGTCLAAMELAVEYMLGAQAWQMIVSVMKGTAFCSAAVLAGYIREWLCDRKKEFQDMEILHPVRQWMEEYQESFEIGRAHV